jgi:hypothetical protein
LAVVSGKTMGETLAEAVMADLDCADVFGHRDELIESMERHLGRFLRSDPDPTGQNSYQRGSGLSRAGLANALLDAVEEALQTEALPANVHGRVKSAYNAVIGEANR